MKQNPQLNYVVPAGYYLPADKKVQKKKETNLILMAVILLVLGALLLVVFTNVMQKAFIQQTFGEELDVVHVLAEEYDKGDITLSGETKTVEAGAFRLTIPAECEQILPKDSNRLMPSDGYRYMNEDELVSILINKGSASWSNDGSVFEETLADEDPEKVEKYHEAIKTEFGYDPYDSFFHMYEAMFSINETSLKWWDRNNLAINLGILIMKSSICHGDTKAVYRIETPTYFAYVFDIENEEYQRTQLTVNVFLKEDLDTQYTFALSEKHSDPQVLYGIFNSMEILPDAKERTEKFNAEYEADFRENFEESQSFAETDNADAQAIE